MNTRGTAADVPLADRAPHLLCVWQVLDTAASRDELVDAGVAALEDLAAAFGGRPLGTSTWRLADAADVPGWEAQPGRLLIATMRASTVIPQLRTTGGPMQVQLEPDQAQLLRDVAAGKVARHRRSRAESPGQGDDLQEAPGHGPGDLRKATGRLKPLRQQGLVVLEPGASDTEKWPWSTTKLGDTVLALLDRDAVDAAVDEDLADGEHSGLLGLPNLLAAADLGPAPVDPEDLERAAARIAELEHTLDEVLRTFVHRGHPGTEALQSSWIKAATVARWREVAYRRAGQVPA